MRISTTLRIGLGAMLILIITQAMLTRQSAIQNQALMHEVVDNDFVASLHINRIAVEAHKMRRFEKEFFIYVGSRSKLDHYEAEWETSHAALQGMLDAMLDPGAARWDEADRQMARTWNEALQAYAQGFRNVVIEVRNGRLQDTQSANAAIVPAKNRFRTLLDGAEQGSEAKLRRATQSLARIDDRVAKNAMTIGGAILMTLAFALGLFLIMPSVIGKSVKLLADAAQEMSKGNIGDPIPVDATNVEFKPIAQSLERMRVSQKVLIDRIRRR